MYRLKKYGIENEQDFFKALEEIDREMKDGDIPIDARQLQGWLRFSRKFSLNLRFSDPLSNRVMEWFRAIYGNRLNVRFNNIDTVVSVINKVKNIDFIEEARADIIESVNHLIAQKPQYGSSQWSSLQATEKFIKAYIKKQIGELPKKLQHHDLEKLANKAETLGLKLSSRDELSKVQCSANVRYDSSLVKPNTSLDAHYASIKICSEISQYLIPSEKKGKLELSINWIDTILEAGKFYTHRETKENLFCKAIDENVAHLFLVESYFQGNLIQAKFNQDTKYQKQYKEILDTNEIERLRKMYEQLQENYLLVSQLTDDCALRTG